VVDGRTFVTPSPGDHGIKTTEEATMLHSSFRSAGDSVILLEFNELTPGLMHRFMEQGKLPAFRRLYEESRVFSTDAEEDPPRLEPWIQWVSAHSGLPYQEHGVFTLNDGHTLKEKCIWDLVSQAGLPVWVCGSMNPRYDRPLTGALLPDPWSTGAAPYPAELAPFCAFVQHHVQEHTNRQASLSAMDYVRFLAFMQTHGLSVSTVVDLLRQLIGERGGHYQWKRAVILDKLQWDLFAWYYRRLQPRLATFFSNTVAHLQHCYWRDMEPWHFKIQPSPENIAEYQDAIAYGYQQTDALVERAMKLAGPDTTLIFCTALSQQPCLSYEDTGGKTFYRPRRFEDLLRLVGISGWCSVTPVMAGDFQLRFHHVEQAMEAASRLERLRVQGRRLLNVCRQEAKIYAACIIYVPLPDGARICRDEEELVPFYELFYQAPILKSGMHHRDGMLWIRRPDRRHRVYDGRVPIRAVAPTVLSLLKIKRPDTMQTEPLAVDA
jgi:hypothetical protein